MPSLPKSRATLLEEALGYLCDYPSVPNGGLTEALQSAGFDSELAAEIVAYTPLAYFRLLLKDRKTTFPDTCIIHDPYGGVHEVVLKSQPTYVAALDSARRHFAERMPSEHIEAIILRSPELTQVNDLLDLGEKLEAIVVETCTVDPYATEEPGLKTKELPQELEEDDVPPAKPWWQLW